MSRLKTIIAAAALILSVNFTAAASDLSDWAVNDYIESNSTGLLSTDMVSNNLKSNITREEFCELAINLYERITGEVIRYDATKSPFADCNNVAVQKAYNNGLITGVTENTFEPKRFVTRQEMAQLLYKVLTNIEDETNSARLIGTQKDAAAYIQSFSDSASISDWAQPAMATLVMHNLISGNEYNQIMPLKETTRDQAIVCVNRCYRTFASNVQNIYNPPVAMVPSEAFSGNSVMIAWSQAQNATGYHIIVKNSAGNQVFACDTDAATTQYLLPHSITGTGSFSVIVGANMSTGDAVFSLPVDFNVAAQAAAPAPVATPAPAPAPVEAPAPFIAPVAPQPVPYVAPQGEFTSDKASAILNEAAKYLGIKYVYGGSTPAGFDCSGFVKYVFNECGIKLERVSRDQYAKNGTSVSKSNLQPGDLLFFGSGGTVNHVGIYVGDGQMIHSPSTGKSICYTSINSDYYVSHYIGAKRVL